MRGLVLHQKLQFQTDLPLPPRPHGEARIRVIQAGICSTDLQILNGYMAFQGVLGHEFVGIVDDAPDTALIGKRVVGEINAACRACETCINGHPTHCPHRTTLGIQGRDGAFADFLCLPAENLFVVPDSLSDDQAVFIEPLAAACEIPELVSIKPTDRVVVIGDGKLGVLCAQILVLSGCAVTLLGRHSDQDTWLTHMGIRVISHPADISRGADMIVEATGSPEGLSTAIQLIRPRGTIVLKSTYHGNLSLNMANFVIQEISLIGSRCGPFPPAIRLLETRHIRVDPLIHARYPLLDGVLAMEKAAQSGIRKVMLQMI